MLYFISAYSDDQGESNEINIVCGFNGTRSGPFGHRLPAKAEESNEITIIHTGDFHGHLIPRANVRSDTVGRMEGGLARVATVIRQIRASESNVLYVHTGDTIQGGAEVLYTRGDSIVNA